MKQGLYPAFRLVSTKTRYTTWPRTFGWLLILFCATRYLNNYIEEILA